MFDDFIEGTEKPNMDVDQESIIKSLIHNIEEKQKLINDLIKDSLDKGIEILELRMKLDELKRRTSLKVKTP
jgi:hypothetical protein